MHVCVPICVHAHTYKQAPTCIQMNNGRKNENQEANIKKNARDMQTTETDRETERQTDRQTEQQNSNTEMISKRRTESLTCHRGLT